MLWWHGENEEGLERQTMENPWTALPKRSPYVLPMDREAVEAHADSSQVRKYPEKYGLHTDLPPTPFIGNQKARVVLLNLNPGYAEQDVEDYGKRGFRKAAIQNLTHEVDGAAFFPIDPRFSATSSYGYWTSKLRCLIEECGYEAVADGVFCVQAYPYHSSKFAKSVAVPSQRYTEALLKERIGRRALVIGMRARWYWESAVPKIASYRSVYWLNSHYNVALSPNNLNGFGKVVAALKRGRRR